MAKYVHTSSQGRINLRSTKTTIIDGVPITTPPITIAFQDNKADTSKMEEGALAEKLLDHWMMENPKQPWIRKCPSDEAVKKMTEVVKKVEAAKKRVLKTIEDNDPEAMDTMKEKKAFDDFVSKAKKENLIQGMRDIV